MDRLRVIGRMKESYLPLREIRKHLAALDEGEIKHLADKAEGALAGLDAEDAAYDLQMPFAAASPPQASGFAFDPEVIHAEPDFAATEPPRRQRPRRDQLDPASEYIARVLGHPVHRQHEPAESSSTTRQRMPGALPDALSEEPAASFHSTAEAAAWRRIPIGGDAELLIREDAYHRRRDKIDWLIDWARKVLG